MRGDTDLAMEARELASAAAGEIEGVEHQSSIRDGIEVDEIKIVDERGEAALGKRRGRYITLTLPDDFTENDDCFESAANALCEAITSLSVERDILFAGLGNTALSADSLGPLAADKIIVTRHIEEGLPDCFGRVSCVKCGVMGQTGIESADIVRGICAVAHPRRVITADALTARSVKRLSKTVQISDCGIAPGSGVGNTRAELSEESLGIPVISVGVPTIVGGATLVADTAAELCGGDREELYGKSKEILNNFFVTPKDINIISERMSRLIGFAVNMFAHNMSFDEVREIERY